MSIEYKGYIIKSFHQSPSLKVVVTSGRGGKIPDTLSGKYTSDALAKAEIDRYLDKEDSKRAKAKTNGKTKPA